MSTIELFPFQAKASQQIATRFVELLNDPRRPVEYRGWNVPFYQALAALTGGGKTPILADAVAQIRAHVPVEPLVLWISKAKAVIDQTFANFDAGGKYAHLLDGFLIQYLSDLTPDQIGDSSVPQIVLSTVGTFNQADRADGTLRVHKVQEDRSDESLWAMLTNRLTTSGHRRPLFVVYDEGHNLSDQQTELLLELEPDAILLASATLKIPAKLGKIIERLRDYKGDDFLVTQVPSRDVVDAGLVKRQISLGGYSTIMETALDDMLDAMRRATDKAKKLRTGFEPKAIYVCRTNISQEDGQADNPARPFRERKAPPILIWRYLTEQKGVSPADIAVYCDLKFERSTHPPPKDFLLFSGGDEDFSVFTQGNYKHIIFNLSLQEGWDDPACYFAYIDKSMGSRVQVEQIIGRVLRQPSARHLPDLDLNTASFYIRVDNNQEFPRILETVRRRIASEMPEIVLDSYTAIKGQQKHRREPKEEAVVPEIHIDSDEALEEIQAAVAQFPDFRADAVNTIGTGGIARAVQKVGDSSKAEIAETETPHSNRIVARWLLRRSIQTLYPETNKNIDWMDGKLDARVELTSPAADKLRQDAEKLVDIYLEHSVLVFEMENPYSVGPVLVNPAKMHRFRHSMHEGYSDLNEFEIDVANEIDALGHKWVRNPANGGYSIPLLQKGETRRFFPDFLVWVGEKVFALDPKGDHLLANAASRKLLDIRDEKGQRKLIVRFVSEGRWIADPVKWQASGGYTVWMIRSGVLHAKHYGSLDRAIKGALTA